MLRGKRTRKGIALTFLVILLTNTLAPLSAYALTSGPTAPEATSFEPVDTTDMVNLLSGDLTYNIPLLEVPGPEGGYPLSLSYHAGIQPNEDASWVGLGWTLNPGAINRSVNGYPDDWLSQQGTTHVYWDGGVRETYSVGVSIGITGAASVSFGLSFSNDTYQGFGVGFNMGIGVGFGENSPFGASIGVGNDGYGNSYLSGGLSVGSGKIGESGLSASAGIGFSTNFESFNAGLSGGLDYGFGKPNQNGRQRSASLLDVSLSTGGNKPSLDIGGLSASVSSSTVAKVQTKTKSYGATIPIVPGVSVSLGYKKTRYWVNEKTNVNTYGSIYVSGYATEVADNEAYDSYSLLERPEEKNIIDYSDPTTLQGGAFRDFDLYNVTAQGLAGNMRPYLFQGEILGQNKRNESNNYLVKYYSPAPAVSNYPEFRFVNDFSNSYRQDYRVYPDPNYNLTAVVPPFDPSPVYGDNDGNYGMNGYKLAGSKQIDVGVKIQPSNALGYNKLDRYTSYMIDGFSITNESGVTYHYGLPAYSWDEEAYQEFYDSQNVLHFNRQTKPKPYAYTWYLTSITGPDFVDRNNDQKADAGDWGYWVNFEYGKWSNNYVWRNPSEGYQRDEDNEWKNCSMGRKEVYYLNAIRTRSHIALFEKDIRYDGKGASPQIYGTYNSGGTKKNYDNQGVYNNNSAQSLRLSKIYLLNESDANAVTASSGNANAYKPSSRSVTCNDCELASNVLEKTDVDAVGKATLEAKAIRVINFYHDYSLCASTTNSYDIESPTTKYGKLTLTAMLMRGKGGASSLPPTKFDYELSGDQLKSGSATINNDGYSTLSTSVVFEIGELIKLNGEQNFGIVKSIISNISGIIKYDIQWISGGYPGTFTVKNTKNPSYHKDKYDAWGYYKSDFDSFIAFGNAYYKGDENLARVTGPIAQQSTDVWSLRKIITPLGASVYIKYECDTYKESVLNKNNFMIGDFGRFPVTYNSDEYEIVIDDVIATGYDPEYFFKGGEPVNFIGVQYGGYSSWSGSNGMPIWGQRVIDSRKFDKAAIVVAINPLQPPKSIRVKLSNEFQQYLFNSVQDFKDQNNNNVTSIPSGNGVILYPRSINVNINKQLLYGGGIRVKEVKAIDENNNARITKYDYSFPFSLGVSSGITSYEPNGLTNYFEKLPNNVNIGYYEHTLKNLKKSLYSEANSLLAIAREVPPPGINYEYVTVTNEIKNADEQGSRKIEGSTLYQFEVFRQNMISREKTEPDKVGNAGSFGAQAVRSWALRKFNASIGSIKRIVQFDNADNGKKLSETINHYLHDGLENKKGEDFFSMYKTRLANYKYQGFLQERSSEVKLVSNSNGLNGTKSTYSAREEYPSIQTGQTVVNYVNGTQVKSENLGFDFYSGAVTKTVETDAYGNRYMTEVIPAYRKYSSMGLKVWDWMHMHMLTQTAATYMYKVDANNNKLGLISAQVQTWSNEVPALDKDGTVYTLSGNAPWRMQSSYSWLPDTKTTDGMTAIGSFGDFNFTTPSSSNANWKKTSEITLYDVYSHGLEASDIYNNYAATRMDYGNKKVIVSGGPANYYEMAFSGAEDDAINNNIEGFVWKNGSTASTDYAHTGAKSLNIVGNGNGFTYTVSTSKLVAGKDYMASVWVKPITVLGQTPNQYLLYQVNGVTKASVGRGTKQSNGWYLLMLKINGADITPGNTLKVMCSNGIVSSGFVAYMDDFRFQPFSAATTAYVYDPFSGELTYMLDNNNQYTKYEYDAHGKLLRTYRESLTSGVYKTAEFAYNYAPTKFQSTILGGTYQKQGCPPGYAGSYETISIPLGAFTSFFSPEDANAMAYEYAQSEANRIGSCSQQNASVNGGNYTSGYGYITFNGAAGYYSFTLPNNTSNAVIGQVPVGTYTISITGGNSGTNTYMVNGSSQYGYSGSFPNYSVTGSSVTIVIY